MANLCTWFVYNFSLEKVRFRNIYRFFLHLIHSTLQKTIRIRWKAFNENIYGLYNLKDAQDIFGLSNFMSNNFT